LRACESLQLCVSEEQGRWEPTPMGRMLASHTEGSQQAWARLWSRELASLWTGLAESVRRGASVRSLRGVATGFERLADDPVRADAFNRAMIANTWWVAEAFARSEMLNGCRHVVDVGGGHGALLIALLRQHLEMRGTVYDLAHAAIGAHAALEAARLADRAEFVAGDFFGSVPGGGDAYVLKSVLHDWPDAQCGKILASCRVAMSSQARLFVIERLATLPLAATSSDRAWARSDLNMLVAHGACERTESMFAELLKDAGFRIDNVYVLSMGLACVEAHPNS
jgi:orsellinic acid C2-O-methyltransferase